MKTVKSIVFASAIEALAALGLCAAPGDGYSKRFTVMPGTPLGLSANSALANFPVLVRLSADIRGFDYGDFEKSALKPGETVPSALDILFVDQHGNRLSYEIQTWDTSGTSLVWVRVPSLTPDTCITCHYGNAGASEVNVPSSTWSAYQGVWHLDNVGVGGTSPDSTANGYTAICASESEPDASFTTGLPNGPLGGYRESAGVRQVAEGDLPNGTSSGIVFDKTDSLRPADPTHFTLSAFFLRNNTDKAWDHLFYKKMSSSDGHGWGQEMNAWASDYPGNLRVFGAGDANNGVELSHGLSVAGQWYYLSVVYDGLDRRVYRNGELLSSGTAKSNPDWNNDCRIALGSNSKFEDSKFQGSFDEVRLRLVSYDDGWARAEYATMASPAALAYSAVAGSGEEIVNMIAPPNVVFSGNKVAVSVRLRDGPCSVSVALEDEDGNTYEREIASSATGSVSAPTTLLKTLDELDLAAGRWYTVSQARAVRTDGVRDVKSGADRLYAGRLSVSRVLDAYEFGLAKGRFRVSIDGGFVSSSDIVAKYATGGTAAAGTEYAELSGTVRIPAGATYADIPVTPMDNGSSGDTTLSLTLEAGVGASNVSVSQDPGSISVKDNSARDDFDFFRKKHWLEASGVPGTEALQEFPALIRLREGKLGFSHSDFEDRGAGSDLAFVDMNGNVLPHEIDKWNQDGETTVWVKIPLLRNGLRIRMYYGGPAFEHGSASVWSAYKGVWHLSEGADAKTFANSQGYYMTGINHGTTAAAGIVGPSRRISDGARNAADGRNIEIASGEGNNENQRVFNSDSAHNAFSMWIKYPEDLTPGSDLLTRQQWNEGDAGGWTVRLNGDAKNVATTGSRQYAAPCKVFDDLADGEWHHLVVVYDDTNRYFYVDGELGARLTDVAAIGSEWNWQPMGWGGYVNGNPVSFKGWMDELRFASGLYPAPVERNGVYEAPALVKAEYLNVTTGIFRIRRYGVTVRLT